MLKAKLDVARATLWLLTGVLLSVVLIGCGGRQTSDELPLDLNAELDWSRYDVRSPNEILMGSFGAGFPSDRYYDRTYLVLHHPDTPEGMFSRAWLLDQDGADDSSELYRSCFEQHRFIPCLTNYVAATEVDEEEVLRLANAYWADAADARFLLEYLYRELPEESRPAFLARAQQELPLGWAVLALQGRAAQDADDRETAIALYRQAITYPGCPVRIPIRAIELIAGRPGGNENSDRSDALDVIRESMGRMSERDTARLYARLGDLLHTEFEDHDGAMEAYELSFATSPNVDVIDSWIYRAVFRRHELPELLAVVQPWANQLPHRHESQLALGLTHILADWQPDSAEAHYRTAFELAPTDVGRIESVANIGDVLESTGRWDEAFDLYSEQTGFFDEYETRMVRNRIYAGDLDRAAQVLSRAYTQSENPNERLFFAFRQALAAVQPHAAVPLEWEGEPELQMIRRANPSGLALVESNPLELWQWDGTAMTPRFQFDRCQSGVLSLDGSLVACEFEDAFNGLTFPIYLVYETATGALRSVVPATNRVSDGFVAIHPDNEHLVHYSDSGVVALAHFDDGVVSVARPWLRISGEMTFHPDGSRLYVGPAQSTLVYEYDAYTLELLRTLDGPDWPHGLAVSSDGSTLVCEDNRGISTVWDLTSGARHQVATDAASHFEAHPTDSSLFLYATDGFRPHPALIDVSSNAVVTSIPGAEYSSFVGPNALAVTYPESVGVFQATPFQELARYERTDESVFDIAVDGVNRRLLVDTEGSLVVFDLETREELARWEFDGLFSRLAGRDDLFVAASAHDVFLVDTYRLTMVALAEVTDFTIQSVSGNDAYIAVAGVNVGSGDEATTQTPDMGFVRVFDLQSGDTVRTDPVSVVRAPLQYPGLYRSRVQVEVHPTVPILVYTTAWQDGYGHRLTRSEEYDVIEIVGASPPDIRQRGREIFGLAFSQAGTLEVSTNGRVDEYDIVTGDWISQLPLREPCGDDYVMFGSHLLELQEEDYTVIANGWVSDAIELVYCLDRQEEMVVLTNHNRLFLYSLAESAMSDHDDGYKRLEVSDVFELRRLE